MIAMSSRILPRRMNAMSIQQVAAEEEFPAAAKPKDDVVALKKQKAVEPRQQNPATQRAETQPTTSVKRKNADHVEVSIRKSLATVGDGIQSLLADSLASSADRFFGDLTSLSKRLEGVVEQNTLLKQTNEEQRKVIVALVKKVGALESQSVAATRHLQRIDQRLATLEQPADLDSEWKDLLANKGKLITDEADSAA